MDDQLAHDHEDLGSLLGAVHHALAAGDIAQIHSLIDLFWARLAMHIRAEHLHLFPTILEALSEPKCVAQGAEPSLVEAQDAINKLQDDHDFFMRELSQSVAGLRELLTNEESEGTEKKLTDIRKRVFTVENRLANHNLIEESQVYPWAKKVLSEAGQADLAAGIRRELENLPPRFTK